MLLAFGQRASQLFKSVTPPGATARWAFDIFLILRCQKANSGKRPISKGGSGKRPISKGGSGKRPISKGGQRQAANPYFRRDERDAY
jgi:hypothetical protein